MGANILMPDEDYNGTIIWITKPTESDMHLTSDGLVSAYSGQTLDELIHFGFHNNYIGLEVLGGLPSSIGGAIRGNAGAFGVEMKDVLEKVEVLIVKDDGYEVKELQNTDCQFAYRNSLFKYEPQMIILRGFFQLKPAEEKELIEAKKIYLANIEYRKKNHPIEFPSCGSVFKNIKKKEQIIKMLAVWPDMKESVEAKWHGKVSMGYVIKRLGFSGLQVGGAKITDKHANYISNVSNASANDVKEIVRQIIEKFETTFGFIPELEAEILDAS
jgi:UDP-N-acetylmuramate dehydrogenase